MPEQIQPATNYFTPAAPSPAVPLPPQKKTGKAKTAIFILAGILLLTGAIFALIKFFPIKLPGRTQATLIYWGLFEPPSVMQQVISDYEKAHPGIKIVYSQQSLIEYRKRLQQRLAAVGQQAKIEVPDIFRIHQSWVPMLGGLLSPVPASVYDNTAFEKTFYSSASESLKFQGQHVGVPLMVDGLALFCNKDLFEAKGISFPKDWKELKEAAQKLTTRDDQGKIVTAGVALGTPENVDFWSDILGLMLLQSGIDLSEPAVCSKGDDGKDICPGVDALKFFTNFVIEDRVWDSTLPTSTFAFAKGDLAMYFAPSWKVFDIEGIKGRLQGNFQYRILPVPQLPAEEENKISWATYWVEAVSKKSKHQDEAWEFLKYLSSKEVGQKLFQTQSAVRPFGELFPRQDMADLLKSHPFAGAFIEQAPYAQNWYLSSFTHDDGINEQVIKYYEDAVNATLRGNDPFSALQTVGKGVTQVLNQYGVTK